MKKSRLAILASGEGSNAENIIRSFRDEPGLEVVFVGCNRGEHQAGVYRRTRKWGLETTHFRRIELTNGALQNALQSLEVDWVILSGFLLKIPEDLIRAYEGRMVNIHPSLLPDFGGPGMYGEHVHRAVSEAGVAETGITVHWVTNEFDEGAPVFQASCSIEPGSDPERIASAVAELEQRYFPSVIAHLVLGASVPVHLENPPM